MADKMDLILQKLESMETRIGSIEVNMATKDEVAKVQASVYRIESDVSEIKYAVNRIEENTPKDNEATLGLISRNISSIHNRLDYQIGRIARTEEELHLFKPKQ